jgi:hypothetical protein
MGQFQSKESLRVRAAAVEIEAFKPHLIAAGFDILPRMKWTNIEATYFSCHKNGRFLYVQKHNLLDGWSINSIYLPSKSSGCGIRLIESEPLTVKTLEAALAMRQSYNSDSTPEERQVKYYSSLQYYLDVNKFNFA